MSTYTVKRDDVIFHEGEKVNELCIIVKGTVDIYSKYFKSTVSAGTMIGLSDIYAGEYLFDYIAAEEVTLYSYKYNGTEDLERIIYTKPEISGILVSTMFKTLSANLSQYNILHKSCNNLYKFLKDNFTEYKFLCSKYSINVKSLPVLEDLEPFSLKETVEKWIFNYYEQLNALPIDVKKTFYSYNSSICVGTIIEACIHLITIREICNTMADYMYEVSEILLSSSNTDLFELFSNVSYKAYKANADTAPIDEKICSIVGYMQGLYFIDSSLLNNRIEEYKIKLKNVDISDTSELSQENSDDQKIRSAITDSLDTILEYSRIDVDKQERFKKLITAYKVLPDKDSTDNKIRALRKEITSTFYEIYEAAMERSFNDFAISPVLKMFFYFGYVDEELAGINNAITLYKLALSRIPDPDEHVFTLYEWMQKIYNGEKEPSKNEFDMDYAANLRDLKRSGNITNQEEKELSQDNLKKFQYEIHNVFRSTNQITFGRISSYCPVFSEHNLLKDLDSMYVNYSTINKALENITNIDYTAFYREVSYSAPEQGIQKEFIQKEILPDVIIMPNVGTRGSMWQEYYGNYRNTPARMMISIFNVENVEDIFIRLTGEFRWEICKRIQGARWIDITDRSLTSEYSDYAQFYRKNIDLSVEAKEKIKLQLQKSKNSFKEMFVRDYIIWIKFEANGSARLNKIARNLLYSYCTFSPKMRPSFAKNPMYSEIMEHYKIRQNKKLHKVDLLFSKLIKEGATITPELEEHRHFFEN